MRPNEEPGFDYFSKPYNAKWRPDASREWAEKYVNADGTEDFTGFRDEFRQRHRFLTHNHGDSYLPPSASYYLRHDSVGQRMDIDLELAAIPLDEDEVKELEAAKKAAIREKRRSALRARGITPKGDKVPRSKIEGNEVAARMD